MSERWDREEKEDDAHELGDLAEYPDDPINPDMHEHLYCRGPKNFEERVRIFTEVLDTANFVAMMLKNESDAVVLGILRAMKNPAPTAMLELGKTLLYRQEANDGA